MKSLIVLYIALTASLSFASEFKITQIIKNHTIQISSNDQVIRVSKGETLDLNPSNTIELNSLALSFHTALNYQGFDFSQEFLQYAQSRINPNWSETEWNNSIVDACMYLEKKDCLKDYMTNALNEETRVRSSLYLYALEDNWQSQYKILNMALKDSPSNPKLLFEAQRLSLSISLAYVNFQLSKMEENYIWLEVGMESAIDGELTWKEAFSEFFLNTFYAVAISSVSSYRNTLEKEFTRQFNEMLKIRSKLFLALENHIETNGEIWATPKQLKILKEEMLIGGFDEPIFKHIKHFGLLDQYLSQDQLLGIPNDNALGFLDKEQFGNRDFTKMSWGTRLISEINILNAALIIYGPGIIKAAGSTRLGMKAIKALKLDRLITLAKGLPRPFDGLSIIVLMEFADGHAFKFIYSGYLALKDINAAKAPPQLGKY